jgi:hypothetical protein
MPYPISVAVSYPCGRNEIRELIFLQKDRGGRFGCPEKSVEKVRGDYKKRALPDFNKDSDNALWWLGS